MRVVLKVLALAALLGGAIPACTPLAAQDHPARRLSGIVAVAVEEYGKGVDDAGRLTSELEYAEAVDFLGDARLAAARLAGPRADGARALLDTLAAAVGARRPAPEVGAIHQRFTAALGSEGALELPTRPLDLAAGRATYARSCAACHGARGRGDGPAAAGMHPAPPPIGDAAEMRGVSSSFLYRVVSVGVAGTAMKGWSDELTADERWDVVAYVDSLRGVDTRRALAAEGAMVAQGDARDPEVVARRVADLVGRAVAAAEAGRGDAAGDLAFDAYIAFEPMESAARARDAGAVAAMERRFAELKGAARAGHLPTARAARDAIVAGLPAMARLAEPPATAWAAFLQSFLIILREGFEAILVVGALVAFLVKTGHRDRLRAIWLGVGAALAASAATAVALRTTLRALPATREIIEGATMLVAVVVLFSVSYWLVSKVEAERWQRFIRERMAGALARGGGRALATVAFLAVYREGAETALFYQALFAEGRGVAFPILLGIAAGGAALAVVALLVHRYGVRIPLRPFFGATSGLLYLMAFVFAGKGIRELQEGNALPITLLPGFPELPALGIFPTAETLLAQLLLVMLLVSALARTFRPRRAAAAVPATAAPPAAAIAPAVAPAVAARIARLEERLATVERALEARAEHAVAGEGAGGITL
jgi:high-affinity iron transporter